MKACDRKHFAKRLREVRSMGKPEAALVPLYRHILKLAKQSVKVGACKRAGREILMAKRLVTKYPGRK